MYKKIICVVCAVALCITVPFAAIGTQNANTAISFDGVVSEEGYSAEEAEAENGDEAEASEDEASEYQEETFRSSFRYDGVNELDYVTTDDQSGEVYVGESNEAGIDDSTGVDGFDLEAFKESLEPEQLEAIEEIGWDNIDWSQYGISTTAAVRGPSGNTVFNSFDKFSHGYYTGTDAAKGIDVSSHNGYVNWGQVKGEKIDFAIIRCGYGNNSENGVTLYNQDDGQFRHNVDGCRNNGIPFGVYIYSYATNTSMAQNEADHVVRLLRSVNTSGMSFPIYYDMEDKCQSSLSASTLGSIAQAFKDRLSGYGYSNVGIYSSQRWFEQKLTASVFSGMPKWVAAWNATSGLTYSGGSNFHNNGMIWQFTNNGRVNGISGRVDLNYTYLMRTKTPNGLETAASVAAIKNGTDSNNTALAPVQSSNALVGTNIVIASRYNSNLVLDAANSRPSRGSNVSLWTKHGGANQMWNISKDSSGYCIIRSAANSSLVLDAADGTPRNGSNVTVWTYHGGNNQKWIVTNNSDGSLCIRNAANQNLVLDAASPRPWQGCNVSVWSSHGGSNQKWVKGSTSLSNTGNTGNSNISSGSLVGNGKTISSSYNSNLVLDAQNSRPSRGSNVTVWSSHGGSNQKWNITRDSNGYYTFACAANPNLVLDAANPRPWSGCNISVWTSHGGLNQKWTATKNSDGSYTFRNAANPNLALDAANPRPWSGCNISVWSYHGGSNQKWYVK